MARRSRSQTVRKAWQQRQSQLQQMLRGELPPELVKAQQDALLDQFVQQTLLTQRAEDFGYRVSDRGAGAAGHGIPQFQVDGKFSKDRYNAMLRASGHDRAAVRGGAADRAADRRSSQTGVVDSAFVAPYELERRFAIEKQERELDYALIPASDFAATVNVTDEQIQNVVRRSHKDDYLLPETVDLQYVELTRAQAEANVTVTEQALQGLLRTGQGALRVARAASGRHILITAGEGVDDAAAEKKAAELTAKAKAGADFAAAREGQLQGSRLGAAGRRPGLGAARHVRRSVRRSAVQHEARRDPRAGQDPVRLSRAQARGSRSRARRRASRKRAPKSKPSIARIGRRPIFYDESQKLADIAFASLTELDSVAKTMNLPMQDGQRIHARGRR